MTPPSHPDKLAAFALEEYRALRAEIDAQEAILDRGLRRAVTLSALCYLLIVFKTLPFFDGAVPIPDQILWYLEVAPNVIVAISWVDHAMRQKHIKRIGGYIEKIEAVYYAGHADLGWERALKKAEANDGLMRNRHHIPWAAMLFVTLLILFSFDPKDDAQTIAATGAPSEQTQVEQQ
ncbi:MAG: hypothetical protein AAGB15_07815 [Pseudomonadota bacterium]